MNRKPVSPARSARAHEVRIIGGLWKRSRLSVSDRPGLRPTPDRVRETLFNWLASIAGAGGGELPGWHCFDVFAGTGALGFEAASRGAASVQMCEHDPQLAAQLVSTRERLKATQEQVTIRRGDGVAWLERTTPASQNVVFIDPPFDQPGLYERAVKAAVRSLQPEGLIYVEAAFECGPQLLEPSGLEMLRHLKAGAVHAHLLRLVNPR